MRGKRRGRVYTKHALVHLPVDVNHADKCRQMLETEHHCPKRILLTL
jgi:hypothetical protein